MIRTRLSERFLTGAAAIDRFAYLPFGVRPRVCIGAHFALTEATLVLAELIRSFRIELVTSRPVFPIAVVFANPITRRCSACDPDRPLPGS